MHEDTVSRLADEVLPPEGRHEPGTLVAAAGLVAELLRRLTHTTTDATDPVYAGVLLRPGDVHGLVGALAEAATGLEQLLALLAARLQHWTTDEPGRLRRSQHRHARDSMDFALLDLMHGSADLRRAARASRVTAAAIRCAHARTAHVTAVDEGGAR